MTTSISLSAPSALWWFAFALAGKCDFSKKASLVAKDFTVVITRSGDGVGRRTDVKLTPQFFAVFREIPIPGEFLFLLWELTCLLLHPIAALGIVCDGLSWSLVQTSSPARLAWRLSSRARLGHAAGGCGAFDAGFSDLRMACVAPVVGPRSLDCGGDLHAVGDVSHGSGDGQRVGARRGLILGSAPATTASATSSSTAATATAGAGADAASGE